MTPMPGLPYEWDEDKREYTLTIRGPALQRGLDAKRFPYPHHQPQEGEREGNSQV